MPWTDHAMDLKDAQQKFFSARDAYTKAKESPVTNPNYCPDLQDAEEKMKLQWEELQKWKKRDEDSKKGPSLAAKVAIGQLLLSRMPEDFQFAFHHYTHMMTLMMFQRLKGVNIEDPTPITDLDDAMNLPQGFPIYHQMYHFLRSFQRKLKKENPELELNPMEQAEVIKAFFELYPAFKEHLAALEAKHGPVQEASNGGN